MESVAPNRHREREGGVVVTATAVIRNPNVAVLAAETDRSLRNPDNTFTVVPGSKIYPTGKKTAVVVAGLGGFVGRPLETIISASCDRSAELTPLQIAKSFASSFVQTLNRLGVSASDLTQQTICGTLQDLDRASDGAILASLPSDGKGKCTDSVYDEVLASLEKFVSSLEPRPNAVPFDTQKAEEYLLTLSAPTLAEHVAKDAGLEVVPNEAQRQRFAKFFALAADKDYWTRDDATLAFAGFGEEQLMPSICTVNLAGAIGDQVIASIEDDDPAINNELSRIAMTAQSSAQEELVYGINSNDFNSVIETSVVTAKNALKMHEKDAEKFGTALEDKLGGYFRDTYSEPLIRTVRSMDVPGIARLADLLIRIQELRSMCSTSQATVGGVIEVASITKHEGIRWHRKFEVNLDGGGSSVLG